MRAAIYAGNLHHGGGATGAAVFVDDLPRLHGDGELDGIDHLEVVVSSLVLENMSDADRVRQVSGVTLTVRNDYPRLRAGFQRGELRR